jgi:hypothetical protein
MEFSIIYLCIESVTVKDISYKEVCFNSYQWCQLPYLNASCLSR